MSLIHPYHAEHTLLTYKTEFILWNLDIPDFIGSVLECHVLEHNWMKFLQCVICKLLMYTCVHSWSSSLSDLSLLLHSPLLLITWLNMQLLLLFYQCCLKLLLDNLAFTFFWLFTNNSLSWFFTKTNFVDKIPIKWLLIFYHFVFLQYGRA